MKILELTRSFFPSLGGLETFVENRLRVYDHLGIDYLLASTDFSTSKTDINRQRKETVFLRQYTPYNITPCLKSLLDSLEFDILSVNQCGRFFSDYAIDYAFRRNKKIILTPHFSFHTERYALLKLLHRKLILPSLLSKTDRIVCFTEEEKDFWMKTYRPAGKKLVVIPHYITREHALNLPSKDGNYFLYLGRYDRNKRLDLLLEAFHSTSLPCSLLLTLRRDDLAMSAKHIGYEDKRIRFLGNVSEAEKHKLLSGMMALVLPTDFEAFGIVLLEASSFSKPVICSGIPVLREIMDNNGVQFFNNDVSSLKASLERLYSFDRYRRLAMGSVNKRNLERYTFRNSAAAYSALFREILPGSLTSGLSSVKL